MFLTILATEWLQAPYSYRERAVRIDLMCSDAFAAYSPRPDASGRREKGEARRERCYSRIFWTGRMKTCGLPHERAVRIDPMCSDAFAANSPSPGTSRRRETGRS